MYMNKNILFTVFGCLFICVSVFVAMSFEFNKKIESDIDDSKHNINTLSYATTTVIVNDSVFVLEISDTREKLTQGLSWREELPENGGMFFLFDTFDTHGIWMKNMNFQIDVLWLGIDGEIIHLVKDMNPSSYPNTTYRSDQPAWYVIELSSGIIEKNNLKIGDNVQINIEKVQ